MTHAVSDPALAVKCLHTIPGTLQIQENIGSVFFIKEIYVGMEVWQEWNDDLLRVVFLREYRM